jgi:catechol-2,3-dioxygenase
MIWKLHIGIPAKLGSARLAHSWRHPVTAEDPMMVGAATGFVVTDIAKSTEHYRDVLGFTVTFEYGTPTFSLIATPEFAPEAALRFYARR